MTDLLGVCVSWSETACVIQPEDGAEVSIPLSLIVSGKPVPPRPSVRSRVSTREAESHAAVLWTGVEREPLGDWELRSVPEPQGRLLKRTNSCLAIGDPGGAVGGDIGAALTAVASWYAARDRPAQVQVEVGSEVEQAARDAGWQPLPEGEAALWMGSVSRALRSSSDTPALDQVTVDGTRLLVTVDGAVVRGGIDGDWVGVHGLHVEPEHRRQGRGLAVVRTLLEAAAERGALTVWLHVETDNEAAQRLYASLGLTEHHRCRYFVAG
jgi:ribosomal protein S18 acetylase RimI-like enzyme